MFGAEQQVPHGGQSDQEAVKPAKRGVETLDGKFIGLVSTSSLTKE
jgi:hypothetical protein